MRSTVMTALRRVYGLGLSLTTGGDAERFARSPEYCGEQIGRGDASIGVGEETWMQTTVERPGSLWLRYKMSLIPL